MFRGQHVAREQGVERALIYNSVPEITGRDKCLPSGSFSPNIMYLPSGKLVSRTIGIFRPENWSPERYVSSVRKAGL